MVGVRITNLAHEYDGREVFNSIDFAYDGSCLAVTGPNGSGKSTLLRILAGLITPSSGMSKFVMDGYNVKRELVGLAAPDVKLYAELSTRENLQFLLRARGISNIEEHILSALGQVRLIDRGNDPVGKLSSGIRQRAALAAAIAHDPVVLLLDEPSSNLDEDGVGMLRELILSRSANGLVVIATNDANEAKLASGQLDLGSGL